MSLPRIVVDRIPEAGASCRITGEEVAHAHARRLGRGESVALVDGSGLEAVGRLSRLTRQELEVEVQSVREAADASPAIALCVCAVRAERLSWIAEKATEMGAARLTIVSSERTQRFRATDALFARLQRVMREAAKQAERARWPQITGPVALCELVRTEGAENRLILDSRGEMFPAVLPARTTALLVGPEGGWSDADLEQALAAGWIAVSLAAGLLRAETAAISALALAGAALARAR
ncbi:MAG: RsmE family RNA methyltransferase [Acidobacteriota bacterium]